MMHDGTEDDEISLSRNDGFGIGGAWKWVSNDFYQHSFTRQWHEYRARENEECILPWKPGNWLPLLKHY